MSSRNNNNNNNNNGSATINITPPFMITNYLEEFVQNEVQLDHFKALRKQQDLERKVQLDNETVLKEQQKELKSKLIPFFQNNIHYIHSSVYGKVEAEVKTKEIAPTPEEVSALAQKKMKQLLRAHKNAQQNNDSSIGSLEDITERAEQLTAELWNENKFEETIRIKFVRNKKKQSRKAAGLAKKQKGGKRKKQEQEDEDEEENQQQKGGKRKKQEQENEENEQEEEQGEEEEEEEEHSINSNDSVLNEGNEQEEEEEDKEQEEINKQVEGKNKLRTNQIKKVQVKGPSLKKGENIKSEKRKRKQGEEDHQDIKQQGEPDELQNEVSSEEPNNNNNSDNNDEDREQGEPKKVKLIRSPLKKGAKMLKGSIA